MTHPDLWRSYSEDLALRVGNELRETVEAAQLSRPSVESRRLAEGGGEPGSRCARVTACEKV